MAYMPNVVGIFISGTYLAIPYEVDVVFGSIVAHVCNNNGSTCPYNMLTLWPIFAMWQSYSVLSEICVQYSLLCGQCH